MKISTAVALFASVLFLGSSASAGLITYTALLSGPGESPPNASPGVGTAEVDIDTIANTMHVHVVFSGLLGTTTASHIHCCTVTPLAGTAGVATTTPSFTGFPLGVTSGSFDSTFDLTAASSYNPAFITANGGTPLTAEAVLLSGMALNETYLNIHTSVAPGGEIRGFLVATPEPATLALGGVLLTGGFLLRRKRAL